MSNGDGGAVIVHSPLVPVDCDLRGYRMLLDGPRLFSSEFHASATDSEWRAGATLWLKSMEQIPAGSLPDDDYRLAVLAEVDIRKWRRLRPVALRGWKIASDGRLYHRVVAEVALEGHISRLKSRKSSASGVNKRARIEFNPTPYDSAISNALRMLSALNPSSKVLEKHAFPKETLENALTTGSTTGQTTSATNSVPASLTDGAALVHQPVQPSLNHGTSTVTVTSSVEDKSSTGAAGAGKILEFPVSSDQDNKPAWWPKCDRYGRLIGEPAEKIMFDVGKAILGQSAGGQITKMRRAYGGDLRTVLEFLLLADQKSDAKQWFAGVLRRAEKDQHLDPPSAIYPKETHR
jgi:hypothetical protein